MTSRALPGQMSDADIRLLRIFKAVVEAGGVSAAELELNIGRSAISRHLKDLEIRLSMVLCHRGRGGFSLTEEGRTVYDAALRLLAALDTFRAEVDDVHHRLTGNLSIALFDKTLTNPESHIAKAIGCFDEHAPKVTLELHVATISDIEKGVIDGRFNVGIIPSHRTSTSLDYHSLFPEKMLLYVGSDHPLFSKTDRPINEAALKQHKFVGLGYHSPNMEIGNKKGIERHASCYDQEAVATLILSGRYMGYLPDHYAKSFEAQGLLRPIHKKRFTYQCHFVAINRRSPKPSRITKSFLDCLKLAHQ